MMTWDIRLAWTLLILTALLLAWAVYRSCTAGRGAAAPPVAADPFAAEIAEFNRAVSDWSRG